MTNAWMITKKQKSRINIMSDTNADQLMISDTILKSNKEKSQLRILNLGCGSSKLSEDMYDDGYQIIWNIDYSAEVIQ